jgi:hypothetical protein
MGGGPASQLFAAGGGAEAVCGKSVLPPSFWREGVLAGGGGDYH